MNAMYQQLYDMVLKLMGRKRIRLPRGFSA